MINKLAESYYNNSHPIPLDSDDLVKFAELILNQFIQELENNKQTVAWNYGCDSVIFINRSLNDKSSFNNIKDKYVNTNNKSNSTKYDGRRIERNNSKD